MGKIVLYEGNGGSEDIVKTYSDTAGQRKKVTPNDEARSMVLLGVRKNALVVVYDSPDGKLNDDYCFIRVKKKTVEYTIRTFERSYEDTYVAVSYARKNGLDGKVSRIRID